LSRGGRYSQAQYQTQPTETLTGLPRSGTISRHGNEQISSITHFVLINQNLNLVYCQSKICRCGQLVLARDSVDTMERDKERREEREKQRLDDDDHVAATG
jgi:hypothetical protein